MPISTSRWCLTLFADCLLFGELKPEVIPRNACEVRFAVTSHPSGASGYFGNRVPSRRPPAAGKKTLWFLIRLIPGSTGDRSYLYFHASTASGDSLSPARDWRHVRWCSPEACSLRRDVTFDPLWVVGHALIVAIPPSWVVRKAPIVTMLRYSSPRDAHSLYPFPWNPHRRR
jgi:hypothetical protein